ncbi:MAG: hypothetical protein K2L88_00835, partial [Clostridiales bacterium]|nr:hypothetical protein [Clostridiales bacterium]
ARGHDWNEWTLSDDNKPTMDEAGKLTRTCKVADCDGEDECELPTLMSEDYSKSKDNATCEEAGTATYTYNKDGVSVSFTAETPATGHTERVIAGKATTCYDDGLTDGKECSICRKVLEEQKVIVTTGHKFDDNYTPVLDEEHKTVSQRCGVCNTTVVYAYDNMVNATDATAINSAISLSDGVNYVSQKASAATRPPYLKYTFETEGTYTIYWLNLSNKSFALRPATIMASSNTAVINTSGAIATPSTMPEGFIFEGYATSDFQYYVTDENGNQVSKTAHKGDYVTLAKNNFKSLTGAYANNVSLVNIIPVKLTLTVNAGEGIAFRNYTNSDSMEYFLIGIDKEPTISEEYCKVAEGEFAIKNSELEFTAVTEEGTYTFTAPVGEFELYVNDTLYAEGSKTRFGYVDFSYRYFTVNLQVGDVVTVKQVAGRASENVITIYDGEEQEPAESEYKALQLGEQTITLSVTNIAVGKYEVEEEQFYSFTSAEGGYFNISVAEGVTVNAVIRADKTHYSTIFGAPRTSGVFYVAAGETVIIAFTGNGLLEFDVNIVSCEKPITYLEANETLENVTFYSFETVIELTVGESVAEGTYQLTFEFISNNLRKGVYVYFSVNEEIVVDDRFDSNAITNKYINPDLEEGAHNTVGDGISKVDIREDEETYYAENFVRTVTVKAGDVIYLATSALTAGNISVTLTPVAE